MYLYHSRLQNGNSYTHALAGKFSGLARDELLVCRNTVLELYVVHRNGHIERICCEDLFTRIRSMAAMHLNNKDYVAIGSESGYALVLSYDAQMNGFKPIMKKRYSMPVCLPESPGQFVATSHLGMGIGSLVETHLFFNLYKRKPEDLEKMEPMLAHQPKCVMYDIVGIDTPSRFVPMFATLEVLCEEKNPDPVCLEIFYVPQSMSEKRLEEILKPYGIVVYTYMKGVPFKKVGYVQMEDTEMCKNVISRFNGKSFPGYTEQLLVKFAEQEILRPGKIFFKDRTKEEKEMNFYKQYLKVFQVSFEENKFYLTEEELPEHGNMLISVPKGKDHPFGVIICFPDRLTFKPFVPGYLQVSRFLPQRETQMFQTQRGIILTSYVVFKISEGRFIILVQSEQGDLFSIQIYERERKLLTMRILYMDTIPVASAMCVVSGRLFVATEFGDNYLYDIKSFGNESEMTKYGDGSKLVCFHARKLTNLSVVAKMNSISPVMQAYVSELACNDIKKFIFACGRTSSSTLRFQRYGVKVSEVFEAVLPPLSNAVWSVNQEVSPGQTITYILVSLMRRTMVLAIDKTIKVDHSTGFCSKVPTLGCATCSNNSIIQVNPNGFRHIKSDHQYTEKIISDKYSDRFILRCALHCNQIAVALVNKDGLYFEVQEENGKIQFRQVEVKTEFKSTVMCMKFIPRVIQAHHLVVCLKDTLEIYSVSLMKMECLTTYKLGRIPESLDVVTCLTNRDEFNSVINIGYDDGYLQRFAANEEKIVSEYTIKLGNKAVKLYSGKIQGITSVIALTNKTWIGFYPCSQVFNLAPMDIDQKSDFAFLSASSCQSVNSIAISREMIGLSWETKLHFLSVSNSVSMIEDSCVKLEYTPKSFILNPKNNCLMIAETDIRYQRRLLNTIEMNPQKAMDLATLDTSDSPHEKDDSPKQDLATLDTSDLPLEKDVCPSQDLATLDSSDSPPETHFSPIQDLETSDPENLPPKVDVTKKFRLDSPKTSDTESLPPEDIICKPSPQIAKTSASPSLPPKENEDYPILRAIQSFPYHLLKPDPVNKKTYPENEDTQITLPEGDDDVNKKSEFSNVQSPPSDDDLNEKPTSCAVDSRLHIFDPTEMETVFSKELPVHVAAVCMSFLQLEDHPLFLLVGTKKLPHLPGYLMPDEPIYSQDIYIYEVTEDGKSFSLVSKHKAKHAASAMCQIGYHVLVGHENVLCVYGFHSSTKSLIVCDSQESMRPIVNIWCRKYFFIVETSDEILTYGYFEEDLDCLYMFHQDRFMRGVLCLCFWDDNIIFVGDTKEIHAVLLPCWNDSSEPLADSDKNELKETEKKLEELSKRLAATKIKAVDVLDDVMYVDSDEDDTPSSGTNLPSPMSRISSSKKGPMETTFKIKSRSELAACRAGPSSQNLHSPSRVGLFSHVTPSSSKAQPSASRSEASFGAEPGSSISSDPPRSSSRLPIKYPSAFLRFSDRSNVLTSHKIGEYVRSIQKTSLIKDGRDLIVYTTLSGAVGVLVPFLTETHHKFFGPLEYLTFKMNPLLTSELMAPLNPNADPGDIFALCHDTDQVTVDGNACEVFCKMPRLCQHHIASNLETTYLELLQRIEEMRTTIFV